MAFPMAFPAHHPTFCKVTTLARNMRNERPSSFMRPFLGDDLPKYLCMRDDWWMLMDTGNLAAKNMLNSLKCMYYLYGSGLFERYDCSVLQQ